VALPGQHLGGREAGAAAEISDRLARRRPVQQVDLAVVSDREVPGVQVAVDHATRVGGREGAQRPPQQQQARRWTEPGEGLGVCQQPLEGREGRQAVLHADHPSGHRHAVHRQHRWVRQPRRAAGLLEQRGAGRRALIRTADLDRHLTLEKGVPGEEDPARGPTGDQASRLEPELSGKRGRVEVGLGVVTTGAGDEALEQALEVAHGSSQRAISRWSHCRDT
jgi:hypothetical protein